MSDVNISLKSRLSEVLETLNLIILIYAFFLIVLGVILHNSEVILQTCIMFVVCIVFEYINYDLIIITDKGLKCEKYGFLFWKDMRLIKKDNRIFYIYTKNNRKPYKLIMKKTEDNMEIERAFKFINSKIQTDKVKKYN